MLKHRVKRNKKYNDDYKYGYVNMDFWKSFNDKNLDNYINLAISAVVTFTFTIITNQFMKKKIRNIDMIDSLKSIE